MTQDIKDVLEEKQKKIDELQTEAINLTTEKINIFNKYVDKIQENIKFILENHIYFRHPKVEKVTTVGPIIGYDSYTDNMYIYDFIEGRIVAIDSYDKSKSITMKDFFDECDFEDAMIGLKEVEKLPDILIEELSRTIETQKNLLNKYKG